MEKERFSVPGKLSAGSHPCLASPYSFPYSSAPLEMRGRVTSDAACLQWAARQTGWAWVTDEVIDVDD